MANKKYEETDIQAIAEAIREKTGSEDSYKVSDMASGVNDVYEAGKKSEYDAFWDSFQDYGKRTNYDSAFAQYGWKKNILKPKYQIKPINAQRMFYGSKTLEGDVEGVIDIDFSNCTDFYQTFQNSYMSRLGIIDLRKATSNTNVFLQCYNLVTIDKIIVSENLPFWLNFRSDTKLKNVVVEGTIAIDFGAPDSPLSITSLKSIITHLKDYSGTTSEFTYTVTFKTSAFAELEAEGFTEEDKEWLISVGQTYSDDLTWATVIDNLKWNLTLA